MYSQSYLCGSFTNVYQDLPVKLQGKDGAITMLFKPLCSTIELIKNSLSPITGAIACIQVYSSVFTTVSVNTFINLFVLIQKSFGPRTGALAYSYPELAILHFYRHFGG